MKPLLTTLLLLAAFASRAQIQFWNTNDIENEQWMPFYKPQKLKQLTVYQTDEYGKRLFDNDPKSIKKFDKEMRLLTADVFRYNWRTKKNELQSTDSLFYNEKGQLIRYSSYEGDRREKTNEMTFFYNPKGQLIRQEKYSRDNSYQLVKEGTETFTYGTGSRPIKLVSKNTSAVLDHSRLFSYDKQNRLTRAVFNSGGSITTDFVWNEKNQLVSYKEMNGKDLSKEVSFTYDAEGRRISKTTNATSGYSDNTTYSYREKEMLPYASHLSYTSYGGKSDMRHEFMEMVYE